MKKIIRKLIWGVPFLFVLSSTILWYEQKTELIIYSLLVYNFFAFLVFGYDKRSARKGNWRIPEKLFFNWSVFGASIGILIGMKFFHHKTLHPSFKYGIPIIIIVQLVLLYVFKNKI